jgi:SLBB domain-containing protein
MWEMVQRCDAGACRLRARDLGLGDADGAPAACLLRCDGPVAAERGGRALIIIARGRVEPWSAPPLPSQPAAPVLLRDAGFADQPLEAAARRRGAYLALDKLTATAARELVAAVTGSGWRGVGAFAERVLRDRDPHLVREGEAIAERAGARVDAVTAARLVRAAQHGVGWLERHATILCAVSGDVLRPGLYELGAGATIAEALAAAGGVVAGIRVATAGTLVADGEATTDVAAPAPATLVALHAGRDPIC